jgi:hypothetical protein
MGVYCPNINYTNTPGGPNVNSYGVVINEVHSSRATYFQIGNICHVSGIFFTKLNTYNNPGGSVPHAGGILFWVDVPISPGWFNSRSSVTIFSHYCGTGTPPFESSRAGAVSVYANLAQFQLPMISDVPPEANNNVLVHYQYDYEVDQSNNGGLIFGSCVSTPPGTIAPIP